MIDSSLSHDPTSEDRLLRAKWVRGIAIVYGSVLLLLLGIAVGSESLSSHKEQAASPILALLKA